MSTVNLSSGLRERLTCSPTMTSYPSPSLVTKMVHIGFGAFHKGHQAIYTDLANEQEFNSCSDQQNYEAWGVAAVSSNPQIEQLRAQNHQFIVLETAIDGELIRLVRCINESIYKSVDGVEALITLMSRAEIGIVSLTITEKGYCTNIQTRQLDFEHPQIKADLLNPTQPVSTIGIIVRALQLRKDQGLTAFSVLSCDNIPENGHLTRNAVLAYAQKIDTDLAAWIEQNSSFPCTMVDRIVPAMTAESWALLEAKTGYADPCAVIGESFRQWVIEDNFVAGRPCWEKAGAMMVSDVAPYEAMKLRMLNGSHSFLAFVGSLAGYQYIYQCMQDEKLRAATRNLMKKEQAVSLPFKLDVDLNQYADFLIERFANPTIKHKTAQIAMDSSQKLPQRLLEPMLDLFEHGHVTTIQAFAVAAWMLYVEKVVKDDAKQLVDPLANVIIEAINNTSATNGFESLWNLKAIFPNKLQQNESLKKRIYDAYLYIKEKGIHAAIEKLSQ